MFDPLLSPQMMKLLRIPFLAGALLTACASPRGPALPDIAFEINAVGELAARDVIAPGDLLALQFAANIELGQLDLSQQALVQRDGTLTLMGVGVVTAAGLTPGQLTEKLSGSYTDVLGPNPLFAVTIAKQAPRMVHIMGSVGRPGPLPLPPEQSMTLIQALADAGGVASQRSYLGNTLLVRWDPEANSYASWVIDARERWWGASETVILRPGDVVYVPDTPVVQVNTWIDVWMRNMIPFPRVFVN